jgi:poly(rC)-binding protein 2/3/4
VDDEAGSSAADALVSVFSDLCSLQQQRRGEAPAAAPSPAPSSADAPLAGGGDGEAGGGGGGSSAVSSAGEGGGAAAAGPPPRPVEARMLVDSSLVGFLVGRGGVTIKDTMARSGAGVRVLPKAELPACACVTDEVVRVAGSPASVHAALRLLAGQVKAHTLRHGQPRRGGGGGGPAAPPPLLVGQAPAELAYMHPSMAAAAAFYPPGAGSAGLPPPGGFAGAAVEACFRLLAPAARTGNIIGKGGEHVRRIRAETGARIKVRPAAVAGLAAGAAPERRRLLWPLGALSSSRALGEA